MDKPRRKTVVTLVTITVPSYFSGVHVRKDIVSLLKQGGYQSSDVSFCIKQIKAHKEKSNGL